MRNFALPLVAACLSLPALAGVEDPPKTNSSLPIDESLLSERPYSLNGVVLSGAGRGSGFVAEHPNLFITAGHVLFDDTINQWQAPPKWLGPIHAENEPSNVGVDARGYFRWASYSDEVELHGTNSPDAFTRDVALVWSFGAFTEEEPAVLDYKGAANLRAGKSSMITGYPALIDYTGNVGNFFMHSTREEATRYKGRQGSYLTATHISTGPGNSGGPVWVRDEEGDWKAGGILVAGRPSEDGLYGFTSEMKTLLKAADPILAEPIRPLNPQSKVGSSSRLGFLAKPKTIPDGRQKWTRIPINVGAFPAGSVITATTLNLTITTTHVGDLVVGLMGPDGTFELLHDSEGAGEDDLVLDDLNVGFAGIGEDLEKGIPAKWYLMVQDRLTGDIATVTRCQLQVDIN